MRRWVELGARDGPLCPNSFTFMQFQAKKIVKQECIPVWLPYERPLQKAATRYHYLPHSEADPTPPPDADPLDADPLPPDRSPPIECRPHSPGCRSLPLVQTFPIPWMQISPSLDVDPIPLDADPSPGHVPGHRSPSCVQNGRCFWKKLTSLVAGNNS